MTILCSISTKGRTHTTLPIAIQAVISQTLAPDKLIIFDDNTPNQDLRNDPLYYGLFSILSEKGIQWEWRYAAGKGQHHNHQIANNMGFDWVWRVDDDCFPESNVLENLWHGTHRLDPFTSGYVDDPTIGAVGGSIITMGINPRDIKQKDITGKIENIDKEPNAQWGYIKHPQEVDHLHCSFLYRAGIVDYDTRLSIRAFREETIFTWNLKQRGYKILIIPDAVSWHIKFGSGGIRSPL